MTRGAETRLPDRILVVDDDEAVRALAVDFLRESGYRVEEAHDAATALGILEQHAAELAMLMTDVRMPGESDGLQLARLTAERWPQIAILVTSATYSPAWGDLPANTAFIQKPWRGVEMLRTVEQLTRRRR